VKALGEADSTSKRVVVLDLPPASGGKREFDGNQIRHITDAILASHDVPDHAEIEECRRLFPQYSQAYAGYDKTISTIIGKDIEQFRALAAKLAAGQ
jgi:L-ascorbate metabolism protein UlaG (beta-lactamase superfamily)